MKATTEEYLALTFCLLWLGTATILFIVQAENFFNDLRNFGTQIISHTLDIDDKTASQIAGELANRLAEHWGGSMFYVTKNNAWQYHERDLQIWEAFNGNNHFELVQKFNLSLPYIYEILARMRKEYQDRSQSDLFSQATS